jgi:hypothetical protein
VEILGEEPAQTCARFWRRAHHWFARHAISVLRVLNDTGSATAAGCSGPRWPQPAWAISHQASRPQTNEKVERCNRSLLAAWADRRL